MSNLKRAKTPFVARKTIPPVEIGNGVINSGLPTMIVTLNMTEDRAFRNFKKWCKRAGFPIGWEEIDANIYVCSGLHNDLLALTDRWWVKEWWWDHNIRVVGGSGAGERPKHKGPTVAQIKSLDLYSESKMTKVR